MIRLKIAVALAIIRKKPPHLTGSQYAGNLQALFSSHQNHDDNNRLQEDVETIAPSQVPSMSDSEDIVQNNGGCETLRNISEVNDIPSCLRTSSKQTSLIILADRSPELFEVENTRFMQSVISLNSIDFPHNVTQKNGVQSCTSHVTTLSEILLRDFTTLPASCLQQGANAVCQLMDKWQWLNECERFMKAVCDMIDAVLMKLTTITGEKFDWISLYRKKRAMVDMLLVFMTNKSTALTSTILETVLETWEHFCDGLRSSRSLAQPLDAVVFENSFFIIQCLERIVKQWLTVCHLHPFFLEETQERLDKSLLHLTDPFPLVSQAVWKVCALIEKVLHGRVT